MILQRKIQKTKIFSEMKTTKELAWELGFLRKRKSSTTEIKKLKRSCQLFSHIIVMDFESTCWKDGKYRTQEIIEFPAVLLNTSTGEIESEFHYYVQPQENPVLSDFCKELTGISQDQVEQGIPLSVCLKKFSAWLKTVSEVHHVTYYRKDTDPSKKACTFVTWSDWDLAVCLHYEAQRKQLRKPEELCSWIDLRATYRNFYERKPKGLNGALQDLGIDFEGREHSGLHDSRNTAKLAWRMMCDGCILKVTKSLTPALSSRTRAEKLKWNCVKPGASSSVPPKLFEVTSENGPSLKSVKIEAEASKTVLTCTSVPDHNIKQDVVEDRASRNSVCSTRSDSVNRNVFRDITNMPKQKKSLISSERVKTPTTACVKSLACCSHSAEKTKNTKQYVFKTPCSMPNNRKSVEMALDGRGNVTVSSMKAPVIHALSTGRSTNSSANTSGQVNSSWLSSGKSFNGSVNIAGLDSKFRQSAGHTLKKTPPMCECGRRAVRKFVQSPGPNLGRVFFCCPLGHSTGGHVGLGKRKSGCGFFTWEVEASASPSFNVSNTNSSCISSAASGSVYCKNTRKPSLPQPDFSTPKDGFRTASVLQCSQKKTLGIKKSY